MSNDDHGRSGGTEGNRQGAETGTTSETLAERLAREVLEKRDAGLPEEVLRQTVVRVIDTIGVALAGFAVPPGRVAADVVMPEVTGASSGAATIWGDGRRAGAADAAFANSVAAHALDYDDSSADTVTHTGAIAVPVGLAVGEEKNATAREVLAAIACGYQVANFIERLAHHEFQPNGFQSAAVAGLFGGVVVAGCLEGASRAELADALAIATSMAGGLMEFLIVGGDTKPVQVGWAAHGAIVAARLARRGLHGPRTAFEGRYGLYSSYVRKQLDDTAVRDEPLWDRYAVLRTSTKPYPTCLGIHAAADAFGEIAAELRAEGADAFADVEEVHCDVPDFAARLVLDPLPAKRRPQTSHEARFSLPYCLARIALDGCLNLASFEDDKLADPKARAFMDRVTYSVVDGAASRAVVHVSGTSIGRRERSAGRRQGEPHEWTTEAELHAKFLDAGRASRSEEELAQLYEAASGLFDTDELAPLLGVLRRDAARASALA